MSSSSIPLACLEIIISPFLLSLLLLVVLPMVDVSTDSLPAVLDLFFCFARSASMCIACLLLFSSLYEV
eukprot:m.50538 g.50538  ORF g.50538 m.50538 type:complete len:69 (-) comp12556_c0_seq1:53-259(-)